MGGEKRNMKTIISIEEILEIINPILEDEILTISDIEESLKDKGLDSIKFVLFIVELENKFQIEIPDEYLLYSKLPTIAEVHKIVNELVNA